MGQRFVGRFVGTGLLLFGIVILLGTGAYFAYGQYEQAALARQVEPLSQPTVTRSLRPAGGASDSATAAGTAAVPTAVALPTRVDAPAPELAPTATVTTPSAIQRISASSIGLDAKVAESPIVGGQWVIPKFEAGHLQGTAQPGTGGNVVLAGHVQSITSGDVFANIDQLKAGDTIKVYTRSAAVTYVVQKVMKVSNDDVSVLQSGPHETLTLITCSGTWLPLQHDYSERTVIVAERV